jgi:hypothetical protein
MAGSCERGHTLDPQKRMFVFNRKSNVNFSKITLLCEVIVFCKHCLPLLTYIPSQRRKWTYEVTVLFLPSYQLLNS